MIIDQENLNKDNKNKVVQRYQILKYLVNQLKATFMIHNYKRQLKDLRKEECNNNNKVNLLEQLNNLKINYKKQTDKIDKIEIVYFLIKVNQVYLKLNLDLIDHIEDHQLFQQVIT